MAKTFVVLLVLSVFLASMLAVQGTPAILDYGIIQQAKKGFELGKSIFLQGSANFKGTGEVEVGILSKGTGSATASAKSPTTALNVLGKILADLQNGSVPNRKNLGAIAKDLSGVTSVLIKIGQMHGFNKRGPTSADIKAFMSLMQKLEKDFYGCKQA